MRLVICGMVAGEIQIDARVSRFRLEQSTIECGDRRPSTARGETGEPFARARFDHRTDEQRIDQSTRLRRSNHALASRPRTGLA